MTKNKNYQENYPPQPFGIMPTQIKPAPWREYIVQHALNIAIALTFAALALILTGYCYVRINTP